MTTVQIIGVSVAGAVALLLIIALIVTRRHGADDEQDQHHNGSSFLDQDPQDTFAALGKPEQPVEDITLDPAVERAAERADAERAAAIERTLASKQPQPGGLGLDWGPDLSVRELGPDLVAAAPSWDDEAETTGELQPGDESEVTGELQSGHGPAPQPEDTPATGEGDGEDQKTAPEPGHGAEAGPGVVDTAPGSGPDSRLVPLSDIIVTTSNKLVDLNDPDVRRMLTELVTFEIDQAADFRRRGQGIDAVLQLTEAEKVSRALGMTETAQRIRAMVREINEAD